VFGANGYLERGVLLVDFGVKVREELERSGVFVENGRYSLEHLVFDKQMLAIP
jgi:hypothetical protein